MEFSDVLYMLAGMSFGVVLGAYIFRPVEQKPIARDFEMLEALQRDGPRFHSVWRQRGYDDYLLDGTNDATSAPEGYARTEYNLGHDIALAEDRAS